MFFHINGPYIGFAQVSQFAFAFKNEKKTAKPCKERTFKVLDTNTN